MISTVAFGTCACGAAAQLFRTGKCAHCYIADLEQRIADAIPRPIKMICPNDCGGGVSGRVGPGGFEHMSCLMCGERWLP